MAEMNDVMQAMRDSFTVRRVFGDPVERDGTAVIPVASVSGGGGGGTGTEQTGEGGTGGGFGGMARPVGVYVVRADGVEWQPAVDVNRLGMAGIVLGTLVVLTIRTLIKHS